MTATGPVDRALYILSAQLGSAGTRQRGSTCMSDMEDRDMGVASISGSGGMGSKAYTISRGSMAYQAPGSSDL